MDLKEEKIKLLLEDKSILEDELIQMAALVRKFQTQSKNFQEELEKVENSYRVLGNRHSLLETELSQANSQIAMYEKTVEDAVNENLGLKEKLGKLGNDFEQVKKTNFELLLANKKYEESNEELSLFCKQLSQEYEEIKLMLSDREEEVTELKELLDKDKGSHAIQELSYIILSKEHNPNELPIKNFKYNQMIIEGFENKIKLLEQENSKLREQYEEILFKYLDCLKDSKDGNLTLINFCEGNEERASETEKRLSFLDFEIDNIEKQFKMMKYEEKAKQPFEFCSQLEDEKNVNLEFLLIQATAIEDLLQAKLHPIN